MNPVSKIGIKHDAGKPLLGLVHQDFAHALLEIAKVTSFGANKYTPSGWKLVKNGQTRYYNALHRHLNALDRDETLDPESSLPHAAHAAWNALAVLELLLRDQAIQQVREET